MNNSERFRINAPKVVHEIIDGEVVIVNLDRGDYYSLLQTGADIWDGIARGLSRCEIVDEMIQRYAGDRAIIEQGVHNFIAELLNDELIGAEQTHEGDSNGKAATMTKEGNGEKPNFEPPSLQKYTDMEELLALDPIHDVDEAVGWPSTKVEV
jgi:Coenzyme PQQ synthesis protein D (PqqD)